MKTSEIRSQFINYFSDLGHEIVPSSSLVPGGDSSLLFTNAGMVQFKDVFLGIDKRPYTKAATVQRCVRAGGKHNDLENVGYTARHHTFFEMLGFFSFGDYFKREAIQYAWDFLTKILKLPAEKLWITVYKDDDEAALIWLNEIGVSKDRFSRCDEKDNFWAMGDTGPCGPCSEIFYDHGEAVPGGPPGTKDAEGDRYIEIWNLVFMQYNRDKDGTLHPLPNPAVDTGMGLERLAAVVQGVHSNYEIDDFQDLIHAILKLSYKGDKYKSAVKVVADHLRACAFLIADGVYPTNEGRGYVLRRIIRRAIRHGHHIGLPTPFFAALLPALLKTMGAAYPILYTKEEEIKQVFTQEEEQFARTLETGLSLLQEAMTKNSKNNILDGAVAFKLYDTYGFPFDLTQDILREEGFTVDNVGFDKCMQEQRNQSKAKSLFNRDAEVIAIEGSSSFKGYAEDVYQSEIVAMFVDKQKVATMQKGTRGIIVLAATPFYAESGGQVGDTGVITLEHNEFHVSDTKRQGAVIMHYGILEKGSLHTGQIVTACIDSAKRQAIRANHTATHLLHAALKKVIGQNVEQKGSLVENKRARFDFSYSQALTSLQLEQVENLVNEQIRANQEVVTQLMSYEEACSEGAVALFGEKYGNKVRVLTIGDFSKELCGGTHAKRTGDLGFFKITAEFGIANGIRRIEMLTAKEAVKWVSKELTILDEIANLLKTTRSEAKNKVLLLLNDIKVKEKELQEILQKQATLAALELLNKVQKINNVDFLMAEIKSTDMQGLRVMLDSLRNKLENAIIILYSQQLDFRRGANERAEGVYTKYMTESERVCNKVENSSAKSIYTKDAARMNLLVYVSQSLADLNLHAATLAKSICEKSGGRAELAQGGGDIPADLDARLKAIVQKIRTYKG